MAKLFIILIFSTLLFSSCKPDQAPTEYNKVIQDIGRGDGPDNDIDPPVMIETVANCEYARNNRALQTQTYTISFPAAIECSFNDESDADPFDSSALNEQQNGIRLNDRIRARVEQYQKISLPKDSIICDFDFHFPSQKMKYDDEILLTINDYVAMSSQNYSKSQAIQDRYDYVSDITYKKGDTVYANGLKVNSLGLVEYKWLGNNSLYNLYYGHNVTNKYCLGILDTDPLFDEKCEIPNTQTKGQIKLEIPSKEIIKLGLASTLNNTSSQETDIKFGFITIGDDNDGDCEHSAYSFDVDVKYFSK